jgi:hypothetical protein
VSLGRAKKVHPAGLEPATFGSVDRRQDFLTRGADGGFGNQKTGLVPVLVPQDRIGAVSAVITNGSLADLAARWASRPLPIQEAILTLLASVDRARPVIASVNLEEAHGVPPKDVNQSTAIDSLRSHAMGSDREIEARLEQPTG